MANITNTKISAKKSSGSGNIWEITVEYDATFTSYELNNADFSFRDGFVLWEDDPVWNDQLTGVVGVSVFNPSKSPTHRRMSARIDANTLNTEAFREELFARVRLRNMELNWLYPEVRTPLLKLSP